MLNEFYGVQEFPLRSSLDPAEYDDPVSKISSKHIDGQSDGLTIGKVWFTLELGFVFDT
jgi:hypothetical protein